MSFLNDYQTYTSSLECPEIFQVWCAYAALSSAAQRKVWLDMGLFKVAPNLYVILVAPPGKCGKSTATGIVRELISSVEAIRSDSGSSTMEALLVTLEKSYQRFEFPSDKSKVWGHSSLTFFANEMSVFIKANDKNFVAHLNDLFDCKSVHRHTTKHSGSNVIVNPYLNILGCTTPKWISENVHEDVIEGGLTARTLLVYSDRPKAPNPFPSLTLQAIEARNRILSRLNQITLVGGEFKFSKEARDFYAKWYISHKQKESPSFQLEGFWNRKHVHLLKLSMLNSLARSGDLTIQSVDLDQGLAILNLTEPSIETALKGVGRNVLHPIAIEIENQIKAAGKIKLATLISMNRWQVGDAEFKEVIETLTKMHRITTICEKIDDTHSEYWVHYIKEKPSS